MTFQDLLANTTTKRNELKPFFNTGETPTQENFHDLIDGLFLIQGNGLFKDDKHGLSIQTSAEDLTKTALLFYDAPDQEPTWTMDILDGFHLKGLNNNARFSVSSDGNVGIGTTTPAIKLVTNIKTAPNQVGTGPGSGGQYSHPIAQFTNDSVDGIRGIELGAPSGSVDGPVYLKVSGTANRFSVVNQNNDENLTVLDDGKVGIGTSNPLNALHVHAKENGHFLLSTPQLNPSSNILESLGIYPYYKINGYNGGNPTTIYEVPIKNGVRNDILFTWRSVIDGSGIILKGDTSNVGIGTLTPSDKLTVHNGDMRLENGFLRFENTPSNASSITGYNLVFYRDNTYYNYNTGFGQSSNKDVWFNAHEGSFKFLWANNDRLTINLRSNTSAYYVIDAHGKIASSDGTVYTSDERYKKEIETITPDMLAKLGQVRGTTFKWRTDEFEHKNFSEGTKMGFIAQELKEVFPDLVNEGADGYYSINYTGLIPLLVEAVKELNQKNQALEERVGKLEK